MQIFYRISDNTNQKLKLPGITKELCLKNFHDCFKCPIVLIADNCSDETVKMCQEILGKVKIYRTTEGNAGSFRFCLNLLKNVSSSEVIYFVEDDYLHRLLVLAHSPNISPQEELEMILNRNDVDYATLYDHPDKYQNDYEKGEITKIFRTEYSHWKFSLSTTMTFAAKKKTILEDIDIWKEHTTNEENHPYDHRAFLALKEKGRQLAVRIPGMAFHADLSPIIEPAFVDKWAIEIIENEFFQQLLTKKKLKYWMDAWMHLPHETNVRRLMMMSAMVDMLNSDK